MSPKEYVDQLHGNINKLMDEIDTLQSHQDEMVAMREASGYSSWAAVISENEYLRADAERYRWMKANVRNGSFGTDTGWIDDDTEHWDDDLDLKMGITTLNDSPENPS